MDQSPHIIFRDFTPSPDERATTEKKANKLLSFYHKVIGCQVLVEAPHRHHQRGNLFHVRITLNVPGEEIVVGRDPQKQISHKNLSIALKDAFEAAQRQLRDYVERKRDGNRQERPDIPAELLGNLPAEDAA